MPIVIRRNNRPSGWEQLGRGIQDTIKQYQQGNVALSKEQDLITREMLNLALQDRRMRDANARDERRTQMTLDLERRRAEQDDKWRRGLRQQDSGLRQSAGSGSRWQAANMKDRTDTPVRFNAYAGETVPSGEWGGENRSVASGPGNPQLSATLNSMGISTATPAQAAHPDMLMRLLNQFRQSAAQPVDLSGLSQKNTRGMTSQQIGQPVTPEWGQNYGAGAARQASQTMPQTGGMMVPTPPAPQAGSQTGGGGYQAGMVIDAQGRPVDVDPRRARWGAQQKMYFDGREYVGSAAQSPRGVVYKIDSVSPVSATERKDAAEADKIQRSQGRERKLFNHNYQTATMAFDAAENALEGRFESAPLRAATSYIPGTTAYDLGENLETLKALFSLDRLAELKQASPNGASGMGALSDTEGKRLAAVYGSLSIGQSREQLLRNLKNARNVYNEMLSEWGYEVPQSANATARPAISSF